MELAKAVAGLDVGCEIKRRQVCPELELPLTEVENQLGVADRWASRA